MCPPLILACNKRLHAHLQGSFGRVFLGKWRETTVAIKLLSQPLVPHTSGDMWADGTDDGFSISTSHRHNRYGFVSPPGVVDIHGTEAKPHAQGHLVFQPCLDSKLLVSMLNLVC